MANDSEDRRTQWEAMGHEHERPLIRTGTPSEGTLLGTARFSSPPKVEEVKYETEGGFTRRESKESSTTVFFSVLFVVSLFLVVILAYIGIWTIGDASTIWKLFLTSGLTMVLAYLGACATERSEPEEKS